MQGILFFDEADANTTFHVREKHNDASHLNSTPQRLPPALPRDAPAYFYESFVCNGSIRIAELRATLLWWLDAQSPCVHLSILADGASATEARSSQTRMMAIELPIQNRRELLTCGVTMQSQGAHCLAVAWLTRRLESGYVRVMVQRETDSAGLLLMLPEGNIVHGETPRSLVYAFYGGRGRTHTGRGHSRSSLTQSSFSNRSALTNNAADEDDYTAYDPCEGEDAEVFFSNIMGVSACVFTGVPAQERDVAAIFAATNGQSVWRIVMHLDGETKYSTLRDSKQHEVVGSGEEDGVNSGSGGRKWLSRIMGRGDASASSSLSTPTGALRRFLTVSAVQRSPYIALVRWNGVVEFYDAYLVPCSQLPPYQLPRELVHSTSVVQQWASLHHGATEENCANSRWYTSEKRSIETTTTETTRAAATAPSCVHLLTCFGTQEGRRCAWSVVPELCEAGGSGEMMSKVQPFSHAVTPPTATSSPTGCAVVTSGTRMAVVWDLGVEEEAHLLPMHSIGSLLQASQEATSILQVLSLSPSSNGSLPSDLGSMRNYVCHGGRMHALLIQEDAFVAVEKRLIHHRLHCVTPIPGVMAACCSTRESSSINVVARLIEGVLIANDDESADTVELPSAAMMPCSLHFVPTVEEEDMDVVGGGATCACGCGCATGTVGIDGAELEAFLEGVEVFKSCSRGVDLLAELLGDTLSNVSAGSNGQLARLPRVLSEAFICGYSPSCSGFPPASVEAAVAHVMATATYAKEGASRCSCGGPQSVSSTPASLTRFCNFSRHFICGTVERSLLHRIAFLLLTYVGWASTGGKQHDGVVAQKLTTALTLLTAAYHTVQVAGADLVELVGEVDSAVADRILAIFLPTKLHAEQPEEEEGNVEDRASSLLLSKCEGSTFAVQVAVRLARCRSFRCLRACATWAMALSSTFPLLQHFALVADIDAGRTTRGAELLAACLKVRSSLAAAAAVSPSGEEVVPRLLLNDGLLLTDAHAVSALAVSLPLNEIRELLRRAPHTAGPKLYSVGVLRRLVPCGSLHVLRAPACIVRNFFLPELVELMHAIRGGAGSSVGEEGAAEEEEASASLAVSAGANSNSFKCLEVALQELLLDCRLCLSLASLEDCDYECCLHDLQAALELAEKLGVANAYADQFHTLLGHLVASACASQRNMDALCVVSNGVAQLHEILTIKWYNYIARLPTKSASASTEALRCRAIMGLHRYLMNRHAYAQCGRVMSDLATLLRCSPLRRSHNARISVGELANMALMAVHLIAPSAPAEHIRGSEDRGAGAEQEEEQESSAFGRHGEQTGSRLYSSPLSLGYSWQQQYIVDSSSAVPGGVSGNSNNKGDASAAYGGGIRGALLSRRDVPWLERRAYQAHCERKLWRKGSTLDCTDLWVDGVSAEDFALSVRRLVTALMEHRLWQEAFRYSLLADYDACRVLEAWVTDLLRGPDDYMEDDGILHEWHVLIDCCGELSSLTNQFMGFRRTVSAALTFDYEGTLSELRDAHRAADCYTAMMTLLEVFETLRDRATASRSGSVASNGLSSQRNSEEEEEARSAGSAGASCGAAAYKAITEAQAWLPWIDAVQIGTDILEGRGTSSRLKAQEAFTAGVFDPLARYARELLRSPRLQSALSQEKAKVRAEKFLAAFASYQ